MDGGRPSRRVSPFIACINLDNYWRSFNGKGLGGFIMKALAVEELCALLFQKPQTLVPTSIHHLTVLVPNADLTFLTRFRPKSRHASFGDKNPMPHIAYYC